MESRYCDINKAGREILNAIGDENTWKAVEHENQDFKRGAIWGMAWAMNHIYAYTPTVNIVERYPCNHCGECPIWLAAFDAEEVKTYDKLIEVCIERKCELFGKVVKEDT